MKKTFYNVLILVSGLSAAIAIILAIWYGVKFRGTQDYNGNLFDFIMYASGIFLGFIYTIILKEKKYAQTDN